MDFSPRTCRQVYINTDLRRGYGAVLKEDLQEVKVIKGGIVCSSEASEVMKRVSARGAWRALGIIS